MAEFYDPDSGATISADVAGGDQWEPYDPEAEAVDAALDRVAELGLDEERVAGRMLAHVAEGVEPVDALEEAVSEFDLSDAGDELEALAKITKREGWR
jgi:hypothetical protein